MATKKKTGSAKTNTSAKKKPTQTKKQQAQQQAQQEAGNRRLWSVLLFGIAIIWLALALVEGASIWAWCHNIILRLLGFSAYIFPLLLLLASLRVALDNQTASRTGLILGAVGMVFLLCAAAHVIRHDNDYLIETEISDQLSAAWDATQVAGTGGFLGVLIGAPLGKLGRAPAIVLVVVGLLILLMLITGTTHLTWFRFVSNSAKRAKEGLDARYEERIAQEEQWAAVQENYHAENMPKRYTRGKAVLPPDVPVDKPARGKRKNKAGTDDADFIVPTLDVDPLTPDMPETVFPKGKGRRVAPPEIGEVLPPFPDSTEAPAESIAKIKPKEEPEEEPRIITNSHYRMPPLTLLQASPKAAQTANPDVQSDVTGQKLIETLNSFNVQAEIVAISRGPSVTRYELEPQAGVRISKITQLSDDIALRLAASGVRIEAPIPNKAAIGIEVPNRKKSTVGMREILSSQQYQREKSKLTVALGKDISGNIICADLSKMPHLLIAGTTGSGKSVCMNTMIISLLYNATPEEVKLIMVDPKQVEFTIYAGIGHLLMPVVSDPRKAAGALGMAVGEMQKRYKLFSEYNVRDITGYNRLAEQNPEMRALEKIVIFIDELSDLMMVAPNEVEDSICRLAQMARAAGMHLVIATQRPSVDVITGIIKANIPSRIALSVSSQVDSRTILDVAGAEKLLGYGDMLYNPVGIAKPVRIQGCFISDEEVERVVSHVKSQTTEAYNEEMIEEMEKIAATTGQKKKGGLSTDGGNEDRDEMYDAAVKVVVEAEMASTTLLQRKLKLGYARASRIMDDLFESGVVGEMEGSKPRKVLITKQQYYEMQALGADEPPPPAPVPEEETILPF